MSSATKKKIRIAPVCPCCGAAVTHQRYSFNMIVSPLRTVKWYVCDECESALSGDDAAARHKAENAFIAYLEGTDDAPAT